jgi:hypothetical protein
MLRVSRGLHRPSIGEHVGVVELAAIDHEMRMGAEMFLR